MWLSVPVVHNRNMLICEGRIDYQNRWVDKHIRSLTLAYSKASFFEEYAAEFFELLLRRLPTICELNIVTTRWIMEKLGITTDTRGSSEFGIRGNKFERPLEILKSVGASSYLSGPTAKPYTDSEGFRKAGIALEFKTYDYGEYRQLYGKFEPYVSALDLLFNCGPGARAYLKSGTPNEKAF